MIKYVAKKKVRFRDPSGVVCRAMCGQVVPPHVVKANPDLLARGYVSPVEVQVPPSTPPAPLPLPEPQLQIEAKVEPESKPAAIVPQPMAKKARKKYGRG